MHELNIFTHVAAGSVALLLGLSALLSTKGGKLHNRSGKYFLGFMSIVILTGLLGVFCLWQECLFTSHYHSG